MDYFKSIDYLDIVHFTYCSLFVICDELSQCLTIVSVFWLDGWNFWEQEKNESETVISTQSKWMHLLTHEWFGINMKTDVNMKKNLGN